MAAVSSNTSWFMMSTESSSETPSSPGAMTVWRLLSVTTYKILSGNTSPTAFLYMYVEYSKILLLGYKISWTINMFSPAGNSQTQIIIWPAAFLSCPKSQFVLNA